MAERLLRRRQTKTVTKTETDRETSADKETESSLEQNVGAPFIGHLGKGLQG